MGSGLHAGRFRLLKQFRQPIECYVARARLNVQQPAAGRPRSAAPDGPSDGPAEGPDFASRQKVAPDLELFFTSSAAAREPSRAARCVHVLPMAISTWKYSQYPRSSRSLHNYVQIVEGDDNGQEPDHA